MGTLMSFPTLSISNGYLAVLNLCESMPIAGSNWSDANILGQVTPQCFLVEHGNTCSCTDSNNQLFRRFFIFTPTWGNDAIWRAYFSKGLKPPTSFLFEHGNTCSCTDLALKTVTVIDVWGMRLWDLHPLKWWALEKVDSSLYTKYGYV